MKIKTIFWLNSSDWFIQLMPRIGVLCSLIGAIGYWSNAMFALNFMIYHSIDCVFWDGMQFPWENLMFELGFMSIFSPALVPFDLTHVHLNAWNSYLIWSYQWLLFRLMLGFGKTKFHVLEALGGECIVGLCEECGIEAEVEGAPEH